MLNHRVARNAAVFKQPPRAVRQKYAAIRIFGSQPEIALDSLQKS
jgi:hypothetical protein